MLYVHPARTSVATTAPPPAWRAALVATTVATLVSGVAPAVLVDLEHRGATLPSARDSPAGTRASGRLSGALFAAGLVAFENGLALFEFLGRQLTGCVPLAQTIQRAALGFGAHLHPSH